MKWGDVTKIHLHRRIVAKCPISNTFCQLYFSSMVFSFGFLWAFFKNPRCNGAVTPSSRFLARDMVKNIDFSRIRSVVELGPGTGVFTREIVRRAHPGTKIIAVELNPDLAGRVHRELGNHVSVENVSAEELDAILARHHIETPDLIVCGLAFAVMPLAPREAIMKLIIKYRSRGSLFRMFTYVPRRIRKMFPAQRFTALNRTWLNMPPATVLTVE